MLWPPNNLIFNKQQNFEVRRDYPHQTHSRFRIKENGREWRYELSLGVSLVVCFTVFTSHSLTYPSGSKKQPCESRKRWLMSSVPFRTQYLKLSPDHKTPRVKECYSSLTLLLKMQHYLMLSGTVEAAVTHWSFVRCLLPAEHSGLFISGLWGGALMTRWYHCNNITGMRQRFGDAISRDKC